MVNIGLNLNWEGLSFRDVIEFCKLEYAYFVFTFLLKF